jgi:hypothetical protein
MPVSAKMNRFNGIGSSTPSATAWAGGITSESRGIAIKPNPKPVAA